MNVLKTQRIFKKISENIPKNPITKAKRSPPKFYCEPPTESKTINSEVGNSTLNFVKSVNTNTNTNIIYTLDMAVKSYKLLLKY